MNGNERGTPSRKSTSCKGMLCLFFVVYSFLFLRVTFLGDQ